MYEWQTLSDVRKVSKASLSRTFLCLRSCIAKGPVWRSVSSECDCAVTSENTKKEFIKHNKSSLKRPK